jgi:hypothetical protein
VYLGNKQEDHVAQEAVGETLRRDIKNNATLHASVDLEHVNKKVQVTDNLQVIMDNPQQQSSNKNPVKPRMIATILTIVYGTPMDPLTVVIVLPLNKKVDHAVAIWTRNIKNNVTLHVNVVIPMAIVLCLEHVTNDLPNNPQITDVPQVIMDNPQQQFSNKNPVKLPMIATILTIVCGTLKDHLTVVIV